MTLAQILILALLAAALYFFYASGYLPVSSRIALLYAGGCRCALGSRIACSWR